VRRAPAQSGHHIQVWGEGEVFGSWSQAAATGRCHWPATTETVDVNRTVRCPHQGPPAAMQLQPAAPAPGASPQEGRAGRDPVLPRSPSSLSRAGSVSASTRALRPLPSAGLGTRLASEALRRARTHRTICRCPEGVGCRGPPARRQPSLRCEYSLQGLEASARLPMQPVHVTTRHRRCPASDARLPSCWNQR